MAEKALYDQLHMYNAKIQNEFKDNWGSVLTFMDAQDTSKLIQKANNVQSIVTKIENQKLKSKSSEAFQNYTKYKSNRVLKNRQQLSIDCIVEDNEASLDYSNSPRSNYGDRLNPNDFKF